LTGGQMLAPLVLDGHWDVRGEIIRRNDERLTWTCRAE
jgi:hypothetical protein